VKCYGETPLNNEYTLKNEEQECKIGPVTVWVVVEGMGEWRA
jgi:hypothetical protein